MTSPTVLSPRMRQILDAAVRVTAQHGLRGLTHRAVDAEAGLPQGSTSAYLRTRLALLEALSDHVAASLKGGVDDLAEEVRGGVEDSVVVGHAIDLFVGWLDEPDLMLTRIELDREALRQPEIRAVLKPWHDRLLESVREMAERVEVEDGGPKSTALVAALDGLLVSALSVPASEREGYVREMAQLIIGAFVTPRDARP